MKNDALKSQGIKLVTEHNTCQKYILLDKSIQWPSLEEDRNRATLQTRSDLTRTSSYMNSSPQ